MQQKLIAIVLHTIKYKDSSLLVYTYTDVFGRQTYVVNGVRCEKNKAGMACFQPLTLLEAVAYHNPTNELQRLKEYHLYMPLQNIAFDVYKNVIALFIGEVLYKTVREHEPNKTLFDFLYASVVGLEKLEKGAANFHLHFLTHLSAYLGYAPTNNYDKTNLFFDMQEGAFTTTQPKHALFFNTEQASLLGKLLQTSVEELHAFSLNREQRNAFINNMLQFYNHHFDTLSPIKSWLVLQEVFG